MVSDGRVLAAEPAGRTRPRLRLRFAAAGIAYRTLEAVQEHKANQGGVRGAFQAPFRAAWWRARLRTRMGDRSLCHVDGIVLVGGLRPDSAPVRAPQRRIGPCVPRCVGC